MGRTVPSYRIALEFEIQSWKNFRDSLPSQKDKEAFDVLMDMSRSFVMAAGNACNPIIFEPMIMSILLAQKLQLQALEKQLKELLQSKTTSTNDKLQGNVERNSLEDKFSVMAKTYLDNKL